ncbi:hypothetical protein ASD65_15670 [Microbacterium sp. Root61]|uniref:glycosyltransferase n=1 Tax=Microbacterium sp. Root61 TaxID=1736570 RepID=UPI0006F2EEA9|nr:glycosyltransferase [Microbacterium sp. Root61]KRA25701.1 hypothetical protein ASD65_15670 [Microbacterium sp. Root61]
MRYAPSDVEYSYFTWRRALLGSFDVFHVHWPEILVRSRSGFRGFIRRFLFRLFLLKLKIRRIPVVRTVHNLEPHRAVAHAEAELLVELDRLVRRYVVMSDCASGLQGADSVVIPHGDFIEVLGANARARRVGGRVLLFGRIEPYKGVIDLIRAARGITSPDVEVRIVGAANATMLKEIDDELRLNGDQGARITLDLRTVSDEEMVIEMTQADLIALPYRDAGNGNSGVAMVALSLDRPVLVYQSCIMERLAEETGPEWVHLMDQPISGPQIESALARVAELDSDSRPPLVGRDWKSVASAYADVFRAVAGKN